MLPIEDEAEDEVEDVGDGKEDGYEDGEVVHRGGLKQTPS